MLSSKKIILLLLIIIGNAVLLLNISDSTVSSEGTVSISNLGRSSDPIQWVNEYAGAKNDSFADLKLDSTNGIIVAGSTTSKGSGKEDILLLKYNVSGQLLWEQTWGGLSSDQARALAIDNGSNSYITGFSSSFGTVAEDVIVLKYNASGSLVWERQIDLGGDYGERGLGIALDNESNVYVSGAHYNYIFMVGWIPRLFVLKLNATGDLQWLAYPDTIMEGFGEGITLDSQGNSYVAGYGAEDDCVLVKFDSVGTMIWAQRWGAPDSIEWGKALWLNESAHRIIVAGYCENGVFLLNYDLEGAFLKEKFCSDCSIPTLETEWVLINEIDLDLAYSNNKYYLSCFSGEYGTSPTYMTLLEIEIGLEKWRSWRWISSSYSQSYGLCVELDGFGKTIVLGGYGCSQTSAKDGILTYISLSVFNEEEKDESEEPNENKSSIDKITFSLIVLYTILIILAIAVATGGYLLYNKLLKKPSLKELDLHTLSPIMKRILILEENDTFNNDYHTDLEYLQLIEDQGYNPEHIRKKLKDCPRHNPYPDRFPNDWKADLEKERQKRTNTEKTSIN